jgi:nicotinamide riboside transporter PnuC
MNIVLETFGVAVTLLAVAGVWYNNRMDRRCFYLWMVSNAISLVLHLAVGMFALAVRDAAFLILSIDGLRRWGRKTDYCKSKAGN